MWMLRAWSQDWLLAVVGTGACILGGVPVVSPTRVACVFHACAHPLACHIFMVKVQVYVMYLWRELVLGTSSSDHLVVVGLPSGLPVDDAAPWLVLPGRRLR